MRVRPIKALLWGLGSVLQWLFVQPREGGVNDMAASKSVGAWHSNLKTIAGGMHTNSMTQNTIIQIKETC